MLGGISLAAMGEGGLQDWVFPQTATYLLLLIGAILVARWALRRGRAGSRGSEGAGSEPGGGGGGEPRRVTLSVTARGPGADVALLLAGLAVFVYLIPLVGFWSMSFAMVAVVSFLMAERKTIRNAAVSLAVAAVLSVVGYLVFMRVFFVPVPMSPWLNALLGTG